MIKRKQIFSMLFWRIEADLFDQYLWQTWYDRRDDSIFRPVKAIRWRLSEEI